MGKCRINKILIFSFIVMLGVTCLDNEAIADSAYSVLKNCLQAIKQRDYKGSYQYFSEKLKKQVALEDHVFNLKNIEKDVGHLRSYSKKPPIFRHYFLDEDLFKKTQKFENGNEFRLFLNFEHGEMVLVALLEKENEEFKISTFYLEFF